MRLDLPASPTSPASTQRSTRLPGWRAIVVRDGTLARPQRIQASTIDPNLDPRYLSDASALLTLDKGSPEYLVKRAIEEMHRRFHSVQQY